MNRVDYAPRFSTENDDTVRGLVAYWLRAAQPFDDAFYYQQGGYVRNAADRVQGWATRHERYFAKRSVR